MSLRTIVNVLSNDYDNPYVFKPKFILVFRHKLNKSIVKIKTTTRTSAVAAAETKKEIIITLNCVKLIYQINVIKV